ncbi:MAG: hypothetical protein G01um1014107_280 [Parcubacteria group bacterium Gr01-1014_107]|nr:MAG: hypothetical protein G01um1014107_280 [Parcubacteria group bacterium Gr01-1014_107]
MRFMNFLKHLLYQLTDSLRRVYWYIFRPKTKGVKCIVEHDGQILFVRLSYAHKSWTIPGGGVGKKESFLAAARRELLEETGVKIDNLIKIGEYDSNKEYKRDHVEIFYGKALNPRFMVDGFEIVEAKWSVPLNLPTPHARRVPELVEFFKKYKTHESSGFYKN